jgi:hypothetical protein
LRKHDSRDKKPGPERTAKRTARTGLPRRKSKDRAARNGQPGQTVRTRQQGLAGQENQDGIGRAG